MKANITDKVRLKFQALVNINRDRLMVSIDGGKDDLRPLFDNFEKNNVYFTTNDNRIWIVENENGGVYFTTMLGCNSQEDLKSLKEIAKKFTEEFEEYLNDLKTQFKLMNCFLESKNNAKKPAETEPSF